MPEHFGLNTQSNPDIMINTRSIRASIIGGWFVNGNHLHSAHHFHQGVPICNLEKLNRMIEHRIGVVETSYPSFYWKVVAGRITQPKDQSCMK